MKSYNNPQEKQENLFHKSPIRMRMDVESSFGILLASFAIVRHPARGTIGHHMVNDANNVLWS